ncbi:MAG TPA: UDP-N-acetylmuramoyl-tripeptide--D-alanyl-D-alanine ligase, partial [Candidatus Polarisedimenticolaceae bacterium]|nr:UDP-N-acetylmuramoyl-tripeptide--D-alanyl-D-alanine ligase [Candidatus Polarisedimenticolaceae bacterium]
LVQATGGELLRGAPETRVDSFVIDTRRLETRGVFFALKGERTDGHRFLGQAAERGAAAVIQQQPEADAPAPAGLILVADVAVALAACGSWVRRMLRPKKWIAVTGSNGKTTTKELIAEALTAGYRVHRTPGNLNNHLGVPLSLLACPADAEMVVLEMGMSGYGEIAALAGMADPDVALITNVRAAHLAAFDSLDDIAAAKGELFAVLRDEATAVVNLDDTLVRVQAARHVGPRVTFGQHPAADVQMEEVHSRFVPGSEVVFRHAGRRYRVSLRIGGAHAAFNAVAAAAVVVAAGADVGAGIERMERLEAGPGRGRVHRLQRGMMLVDDSYNSSPAALASVLETLRVSQTEGRRVLVMGDMLELGRMEGALHREAGKRAAAAGVKLLFAVGAASRAAAESARRAGVPEVHHHADSRKAAESIVEFLHPGDLIVVKGSRAVGLERVVQALLAEYGEN